MGYENLYALGGRSGLRGMCIRSGSKLCSDCSLSLFDEQRDRAYPVIRDKIGLSGDHHSCCVVNKAIQLRLVCLIRDQWYEVEE